MPSADVSFPFRTLNEALRSAAQTDKGITFIESSADDVFFSYRELLDQARQALGQLQRQGVGRRDEVVLQFASLQQLMIHHWACLLGGMTPIPLALADQADNTQRVFTVWRVLERPWLVYDDSKVLEKLEKFAQQESFGEVWAQVRARTLVSSKNYAPASAPGVEPEIDAQEIAFIQFSSGSTGAPKGVVLTHRNLLVNIRDILASVEFTPSDSFLSWKPISHDFGMIAFHLAPVVAGVHQYRVKTDSFIWSPRIWFNAVDKYRATLLGSPNFGCRHFLNLYRRGLKEDARITWDLSCVKAIFNGGEPISAALCDEFLRELAPYGLRADVMRCGYGLAEASLIVSLCLRPHGVRRWSFHRETLRLGVPAQSLERTDPRAVEFVSCGPVYPSTQVRITNAQRQSLPDGYVGHVEIRGENVTSCYYRNPEATAAVRDPEGWVNTQDLGLLLDGHLIIVGRTKEMIIIGGANYFPHDLEQTILREKGDDQLNKFIACGVHNPATGSEQLVFFVYHKGGLEKFGATAAQIRALILRCHGLPVAQIVPVRSIPKTTSGKVQRFKLVQSFLAGEFDAALTELGEPRQIPAASLPPAKAVPAAEPTPATVPVPVAPSAPTTPPVTLASVGADEVLSQVIAIVARLVGQTRIDPQATFFELGLASMNLLALQDQLEKRFGIQLDSTEALDFPSSAGLAEQIRRRLAQRPAAVSTLPAVSSPHAPLTTADQRDIAIIAVATRFPGGADTPRRFWQLLVDGVDPLAEVPADRWSGTRVDLTKLTTRQGGFLPNIDQFDATFFGITPVEAETLDPQQRLLLEVAHEALENTGIPLSRLQGSRTGVYLGISGADYPSLAGEMGHEAGAYTFTGSMFNTAAGRIAYVFGFQGPCVALDTACSSSLTAVHQGIRELRAGACDQVLVMAVNLMLRPDGHLSLSRLNALSATGRCRSFDDTADGYVRSEGAAAVVLKRRTDAERDGDPILAIIKGTALNHNGRGGGLTVPSGPAQERLIRASLADAQISPDAIDYVETHGTATKLGDPQEINALSRVFADRTGPLFLGTVKSNLGHLEAAAGLAGLIKVTLSLQHGELPGNLHFTRPNHLIDWQRLPFRIVSARTPWSRRQVDGREQPRTAGVTSLGINGSNAHLVVQEYVAPESSAPVDEANQPCLFTVSAPTPENLRLTALAFADAEYDNASLAAICQASHQQRTAQPARYATVVRSLTALRSRLRKFAEQEAEKPDTSPLKRVFLFTGQGSHYHGMGRELFLRSSVAREALETCNDLFQPHLGHGLLSCIYGSDTSDPQLQSTRTAQALIFGVEYAVARHWQALGVQPDAVIGHSIGEYAAACIAGLVTLEDAVRMVALRGLLMETSSGEGKMAGVLASETIVRELCASVPEVYLAAVNSPENVTIAGRASAVDAVIAAARARRLFTEPLPMPRAFHTPLMADSAAQLAEGLGELALHPFQVPMISTQLGATLTRPEQAGRDYWAAHLCRPVHFQTAVEQAVADGANVFLEMGGTATLCGLVAQIPVGRNLLCLPTLRQGVDAWQQSLETTAQLFRRGQTLDWSQFPFDKTARRSLLPNTAFHRKRHWLQPLAPEATPRSTPLLASAPAATSALSANLAPFFAGPTPHPAFSVAGLTTSVIDMVSEVTGAEAGDLAPDTNLFSLGIDSLMLVQLDKRVVSRFGVDIPLAVFFSELHTPAKIADYVLPRIPEELRTVSTAATTESANGTQATAPAAVDPQVGNGRNGTLHPGRKAPSSPATRASGLEAIVQTQLELMREQLALLRGEHPAPSANGHTTPIVSRQIEPAAPRSRKKPTPQNSLRDMVFQEEPLDASQKAFVQALTTRFTTATARSKAYAEQHRDGFADWIATLNFNLTTKELTYPIVAERSQGARFWDLDGNEYIDTAMGYGVCLFGHNPEFIADALREQLSRGMELGPQSALAGEVAGLIRELTGVDRVAFSNTGTEAVMVALRLARTVTGRAKIVRFITSFHGSFDGVLAELGENGTAPMAPGIVPSMVEDTVVLHYGSAQSLETLRRRGEEIAAVVVEPVQSRNPGLQPREYLHQLRALTRELGIALIFDEMVTGFRIGPGGAQAHFDVRADLVTYGKIVGGGMPISVVAGDARFLDAIDGGTWRFGDASGPVAETTFFAGTFCKHPLALAASRAVLRRLKAEGPALQAAVTARTQRFAEAANAFFNDAEVPVRVKTFASMYRFETIASRDPARLSLEMNLLFRLMMESGIYVWERRTCFFSTAHTEADADAILAAIRSAVTALRAGGFSFRSAEAPGSTAKTIAAQPAPVRHKLSGDERRIYVLARMRGGEAAYHVSGALRLRGPLDCDRLRRVWAQLAERHSVLRSRYAIEDGELWRIEEPAVTLDFADCAAPEQPLPLAIAACLEGFELTRAPLWRLRLLGVGPSEHVLVLDFHHLVADGASISILIPEFIALYQGQALPTATQPFHTYVAEADRRARNATADTQIAYWKTQLLPLPAPLALPADFPRPEQNDFAGAAVQFTLDHDATEAVRRLARQQLTTPFVVLLSSYFAFLAKLSQQDDFAVGIPYDRRSSYPGFERTVGLFAQTLVMRARTDGQATFSQLIAQLKTTTAGAYGHTDTPLDRLVEVLGVARDLGRNPIFDTLFIYEKGDVRQVRTPELEIETFPADPRGSAFDLTLELTEEQGELRGSLIYATRLFRRETVEAWAATYGRLLAALIAQPEAPLASHFALSADERDRQLQTFNTTARDYDREATLVSLLTDAARAHAAQPALIFGDHSFSYAQLHRAADVLAARLLELMPPPTIDAAPQLVGILQRRSPTMIVSILAVLKAGAAYVPLDPDYPAARLSAMLDRAQTCVLLSPPDLAHGYAGPGVVFDPIDLVAAALADSAPIAAVDRACANDLAYVIFTSGSTGQPKGVMIEHRAVVNFVHGLQDVLHLSPRQRVLGLTTLSFDIFALELFVTLAAGGTLVLASEAEQLDPALLQALVKQARVQVAQMTPSRLQALLARGEPAQFLGGLEMLLVGGEAFPAPLLPTLQAIPGLRILNVYGPTETTVWSTAKDLTSATEITIGRPIANTRAYVLGPQRQLLPVGTQGDLYLAGDGLARGYLADPPETARVFVSDPFLPGEKMYFTGDRASWTADGELICHGRGDNQIKLRGYRIELPEIEAALVGHAAVAQAAVAVRELTPGNPILVAFVVPRPSATDGDALALSRQLRDDLRRLLPAYMVPARVVSLAELPQTPNGKIDRKRLPKDLPPEDPTEKPIEETVDAPHQTLIETLRAIWRQLLGTQAVGRRESFFDVGGNSYSLMLMHNELEQRWPGTVQVSDLFAHPTIDALTQLILERQARIQKIDYLENTFPSEYLIPTGSGSVAQGASFLRAETDRQSTAALRRVAEQNQVEDFDVAVSLHLLYLNKLTQAPTVTVYTEDRSGQAFTPITVDFNQIATFEDILRITRQHSAAKGRRQVQPPPSQRREQNGVISLFRRSGRAMNSGVAAYSRNFDIICSLENAGENLSWRVDYNHARFSRQKIHHFVTNYLKLSDTVVAQLSAPEISAHP